MAIDGVQIDVPDSDANFKEFGKYEGGTRRPFPQIHKVGLTECGTHAVVAAALDTIYDSERKLAARLLSAVVPWIPPGRGRAGLHRVAAPSDHGELLAIPTADYVRIDEFDGLHAVAVDSIDALGRTQRSVLTHCAELHAGQARGLNQTLTKAERELSKISEVLASGCGHRTREQLDKAIGKITDKRWVRDLLTTTITDQSPATFRLDWHIDHDAHAALEQHLFGKRILITDRHTWTTSQLIAGYADAAWKVYTHSSCTAGFRAGLYVGVGLLTQRYAGEGH